MDGTSPRPRESRLFKGSGRAPVRGSGPDIVEWGSGIKIKWASIHSRCARLQTGPAQPKQGNLFMVRIDYGLTAQNPKPNSTLVGQYGFSEYILPFLQLGYVYNLCNENLGPRIWFLPMCCVILA